ncbi:thiol reductase thioredoxin [Roseateles chitinivorans]|uniref:Thiol reductase thioredoxin n=1 Tax=Roseateles chitinivorans TaxID=2917965 RepID=A0A2G9CEJ7_9BURK|nr:thioredoxin family protein [Roseateles chitinivorans]PIM54795.1 thiol reductase thioredoxin [Roseateles chitinivorans]
MPMNPHYALTEPIRDAVDTLSKEHPLLLEFGASWCPICEAAQPLLVEAFGGGHERVQHIKVEDGKGQPLGRSFKVKLWPTLIFMRDGQEVERLVRPTNAADIRAALARIDGP